MPGWLTWYKGTRYEAMISYFIAAVIVYLILTAGGIVDPAVTFTPDAKDSL